MKFFRFIAVVSALLILSCGLVVGTERPEVTRRHFVYHFDNSTYIDFADSVLNDVRSKLIELLGDTMSYRPAVYLLDSREAFARVVHGSFPDWGAAAALPEGGLMAIKNPDHHNIHKPLEMLLKHEYSHLALADALGDYRAPRWFDEGLAMLVSMEWGWSDNLAISKAAVFGEFIPLSDIGDVNSFGRSKSHVAYAQSYLAVFYILEEYGPESLTIFLDVTARGGLIDEALVAATGSNSVGFENEFRQYLGRRFNALTLFQDTMYFWLALALIVIIGAILQFKRRARYYRRWEEDEKLHSTDFDYGNPDDPEQIDDEDKPWQN
ncbi:MAG: hypothetical protein KAT79_03005 [candidate division Zixibacteria bacterium]|nr:hypothetical protein [candidate division Zixibacteria bacterium]